MTKDQNPSNKMIDEFIEKNFGDRPVQELVLLIKKEQKDGFSQILKDSGLTVIALISKMSDTNVERLLSANQKTEDYLQVHVIIETVDTGALLSVLENCANVSTANEKAKTIVDFYKKSNETGDLQ